MFRQGAVSALGGEGKPTSAGATSMAGMYKNGKLTEEGRAKLLKIKEREALKDHLVTKYEAKYGKKEKVIDRGSMDGDPP